jgi:hypothetical protein
METLLSFSLYRFLPKRKAAPIKHRRSLFRGKSLLFPCNQLEKAAEEPRRTDADHLDGHPFTSMYG